MTSYNRQTEELAEELRTLVRHGAKWWLCAERPVLSSLDVVRAGLDDSSSPRMVGNAVVGTLRTAIASLQGEYEVEGLADTVSSNAAKPAFSWLLELSTEAEGQEVRTRRLKAFGFLRVQPSYDTWYRRIEFQFMMVLARQLTSMETPRRKHSFTAELSDIRYNFNEDGVITQVDVLEQIKALRDDVSYTRIDWAYPLDSRRGVLTVEPLVGHRVIDVDEDDTGSITLWIRFDPIARNTVKTYAYRLFTHTDVPSYRVAVYTPAKPLGRLNITATFPPEGETPFVWYVENRHWLELPGSPIVSQRVLPSGPGIYTKSFTNLEAMMVHGLAPMFRRTLVLGVEAWSGGSGCGNVVRGAVLQLACVW